MRRVVHRKSCMGSRNGVALLAVLAFVLLLTILTVSYISFMKNNRLSTASYSNSVQAQEIAQGGLQDIISDLHAEIVAGSIKDPGSVYTQSGTTIYVPAVNTTAVPARIGYVSSAFSTNTTTANLSPSFVRVSRATANPNAVGGDAFFTTETTSAYTNNMAAVPGGTILNRASLASTGNASFNGRSISAARWNKTYLLAPYAANVPTPFTTAPPDWVYVTRTGSRVCNISTDTLAKLLPSPITATYTTPTPGTNPVASPVEGRYAFVMYDEGALLDANVAGYTSQAASPLVSTPGTANPDSISLAVNGKSYVAYADLTQLPGLTSSQGVIDTFVNWRNASFATTGSLTGPNFFQAVFTGSTSGFLKFQSSSNGTDSPFLSRQDLINYFSKIDTNINTTSATYSQALPYLGTFSRAVSAPSYTPPLDSQNIVGYPTPAVPSTTPVAYKDNAENAGVANRDLANVRYTVTGTVTHYYDNQSSATPTGTYAVNVGDPLLQNRFSLARIAWLTDSSIGGADPNGTNPVTGQGPSGPYATAIQAAFGLVWSYPGVLPSPANTSANGGNKCWNYCGPTGTSPVGTIKTLDQVAAEGTPREPNFFELLKAAILSGSLGLNPGPAAYDNGKFDIGAPPVSPYYPSYASYGLVDAGEDNYFGSTLDGHVAGQTSIVPAPAQISDMQIMQIGANIIDQFDADSYPTAIYFAYTAIRGTNYDAASVGYNGVFGATDMVYGDENLPCLAGFATPTCTTDGSAPVTPATGPLGAWWQPEIWNPHQQPNAFSSGAPPPAKFIIAAYGSSKNFQTSGTGSPSTPLEGQLLSFTISNSLVAFFAKPLVLTQSTVPISGVTNVSASVTASSPAAVGGLTASNLTANTAMNGYATNPFVGFSSGVDTTYSPPAQSLGTTNYYLYGTPVASFCMGWSSNGTDFHPYSYMPGLFVSAYGDNQFTTPAAQATAGSADPAGVIAELHRTVDPRGHHLPSYGDWGGSYNTTIWPTPGPSNIPHTVLGPGWGVPTPANFVYNPPAGFNGYCPEDWSINQPVTMAISGNSKTYYGDPDGVVRPADGVFTSGVSGGTGDGGMLFTNAASPSGTTIAAGDASGNVQHGRRPVILNRPFRSVGELGYVFRDLPCKTLDFFSQSSADAALLDVFSVTDESKVSNNQISSVVAGEVDISNAPGPVLQAIISGTSKKDLDPTYNIGTEVTAIVKNLGILMNPVTGLRVPKPILNRAAIVTTLSQASAYVNGTAETSAFTNSADKGNKAYLEAPERALSNVANTRTWNLLIDVIAQSGQLAPTATTLDNFVVQGERRYWLHIAIDRYTGKIVSQQLEPVYE